MFSTIKVMIRDNTLSTFIVVKDIYAYKTIDIFKRQQNLIFHHCFVFTVTVFMARQIT